MTENERSIGGNIQCRRFAYLHKRDHSRFGLLEATNYQNARNHLGSGFHIRQTWLTLDEEHAITYDRERRWEIVSSIFGNTMKTQ